MKFTAARLSFSACGGQHKTHVSLKAPREAESPFLLGRGALKSEALKHKACA